MGVAVSNGKPFTKMQDETVSSKRKKKKEEEEEEGV